MLAEAVVEQIRDLLAVGELSQRKIARRLGVSRGSVNAISQDRRPDYARSARAAGQHFPQPEGVPRRCPGCGGMVQMPCLLCYVRALGRVDRRGPSG
jgi:transcriptional regulator with XRE-family HTH domain